MPTPAVPHSRGPAHIRGFDPPRVQTYNQVSVSDDANRPDQGPPPSANWKTDPEQFGAAGFSVVGNQFAPTSNGDNEMTWYTDTFGPTASFSWDVVVLPPTGAFLEPHFFTNYINALKNGYTVAYDCLSTHQIVLNRVDTNVKTPLATFTGDLIAGDTLTLKLLASTTEVWVTSSGVSSQLLTSADTTYRTTFQTGVYYGGSMVLRLDNFRATSAPSVAVTTPLTLTASSTPTILLTNQSTKQAVLSEAAVALILRLTAKQAAASETATTTAAKRAAKAVAASETATTATQRSAAKTLAVSGTAAATLPRQAGKILAAAETAATTIARRAAKTLAATETAAAAIQKQTGKLAAVSETATATLGRIKAALLLLTASTTATTTVQKQAGKKLSATETASTSLARRTGKTALVSETATATIRSLVGKLLATTETATTTLTKIKSVQLLLAASSTAATTLRKQTGKAVTASETAIIVMRRSTGRILIAASTGAATVAKQAAKTLRATEIAAIGLVAAFIGAAVHALRAFYGYVTGVGDRGQPPQTEDTAVISWTTATGLYPSPNLYPSTTTYPQGTTLVVEAPSGAAVAATGDTAIVSVGASGGVSL